MANSSKKNTILIAVAGALFLTAVVVYLVTSGGSEGPNLAADPGVQTIVNQLAEEQIPEEEADYDEEFEPLPLDQVEPNTGRRAHGTDSPE